MDAVKIRCRDLMIGDWIQDHNGFHWQIIGVGDDYAYATFDGNEGDPWEFDDKDDRPYGIALTRKICERNGIYYKEPNIITPSQVCPEKLSLYMKANLMRKKVVRNAYGEIITHMIPLIDWSNTLDDACVHDLQQALRLVGLSEIADNFKV